VLQRAAFGPREVVSLRTLAGVKIQPLDSRASPLTKMVSWLRENL
jgi:hypothetical protein